MSETESHANFDNGHLGIGRIIGWELVRWIFGLTSWIPGAAGSLLRWIIIAPSLRASGGLFRVLEHVTIEYPRRLSIGRGAGLNVGCWINARGGVSIGPNAILGPYCIVHSANHSMTDMERPIRTQGYVLAPVSIGEGAWLGARVTVLPGVSIGRGAVIGAGSVVTRDVPANAVAMGVPARVTRMRGETSESTLIVEG